jgi:hypothetical protein
MSKKEWHRQAECMYCQYFGRCTVYWGKDCNRQGGRKVPRFRTFNWEEQGATG